MEEVEEELKLAELKTETLLKEIDNLRKVSSSLVLFSLQWKDLESRYDRIKNLVEKRYEEAKSSIREQSEEAHKSLESREIELSRKESNLVGLRQSIFQEVDYKRKELLEMEQNIGDMSKEVERRELAVEEKERAVEEMRNDVILREEEVGKARELVKKQLGEVELGVTKLKLLDGKVDEGLRQLESKEERVNRLITLGEEQFKKLDVKEREFGVKSMSVEILLEELQLKKQCAHSIQAEIDQRFAELDMKEKASSLMQEEIDGRSKELEQALDDLEAKEKCFEEEIDLRIAELESKQKRLDEWSPEVELKEKSLHYVKQTIKEQAQLILNRCREAHGEPISKDKQHTSAEKVIEKCLMDSIMEKYTELDLKDKQIRSMQKSLKAWSKDFELKESMINNVHQEQVKVDVSECLTETRANDVLSVDIRFSASMDGKNLQILLNKLLKKNESVQHEVPIALETSANPAMLVLDAMQGFYPPHLKDGDLEFEASVVRESCIFLLKQLKNMSPLIESSVRDQALKLANWWHGQIKLEAKDSLEVLGFLELIATYGLTNAFDAAELLSYAESVAEHEKLPELHKALGIAEMVSYDAINYSNTKSAQSELSDAHEASEVACTNDQCIITDGKSMLLLLKEHSNNEESLVDKVYAVLRTSGHPEKLVLDTLKLYCSQHSTVKLYKEDRTSFILLLKQLKRIGPKISPDVREVAMKLASHWKEELIDKSEHDSPLADLGFLWILAVYGLRSSFTEDEVLRLLKAVAESKEARDTCEVLGFLEKFTEHIGVLIQQKKCLDAVKYVCAFGLEKRFAVGPLLEAEVKLCKDNADSLREIGNSPAVLFQALCVERDGLKAVIKFIRYHELEDQYAPENLEKHILQLEEDWAKVTTKLRKARKIEKVKNKRFEKKKNKRQKTAHSAESATPAKRLIADHGPPVSHSSGGTYNPDTRSNPSWHHPGESSFPTYPYPNPYVGLMGPGITPHEAPFLLPPPAFMYNFPAAYPNPSGFGYRGPWPYL